jgi:hypothetical protein
VEKTLKIIFYCFLRPENNKIILVMPITLRLAPDGLEACGAANLSSALDWAWDGGVWIEAQVRRIIVLVLGWAEPVQGRDTGETDIRTQLRRRTGSMLVTEIVEGSVAAPSKELERGEACGGVGWSSDERGRQCSHLSASDFYSALEPIYPSDLNVTVKKL